MIDKPGIYDISAAEYRADPCELPSLSRSEAWLLASQCPAVYRQSLKQPYQPTPAMDFGVAAHCYIFERHKFDALYTILPEGFDGRSKEGRALSEALVGREKISAENGEKIKSMAHALWNHKFAGDAFRNGQAEKTLIWRDEEIGVLCRARPDWLPQSGSIIADYKTCRSVKPDDLRKAIYQYGWHFQAAWYMDGVKALGLIDRPSFVFICQEKEPPYLITAVSLSDAALAVAQMQIRRARELFKDCIRRNEWPGYADDVVTLDLPPWAEKEALEDTVTDLYAA